MAAFVLGHNVAFNRVWHFDQITAPAHPTCDSNKMPHLRCLWNAFLSPLPATHRTQLSLPGNPNRTAGFTSPLPTPAQPMDPYPYMNAVFRISEDKTVLETGILLEGPTGKSLHIIYFCHNLFVMHLSHTHHYAMCTLILPPGLSLRSDSSSPHIHRQKSMMS